MVSNGLEILLTIAIPWIILILLSSRLGLDRFGILIAPGILIWKSERIKTFIDRFDKKRGLTDRFGDYSIIIVLTLFVILPLLFLINGIRAFTSYAIPFFVPNPIGYISFESILLIVLPLVISLMVHDLFTSIAARSQNAEIEYTGIAIIIVFLASFVHLVPKSLQKISPRGKMKIISIGIVSNLILILLFLPLLAGSSVIMTPLYHQSEGALIIDIHEDSPASEAKMERGQIVVAIQKLQFDRPITRLNISSANELSALLRDIPSGEEFILIFISGELRIKGVSPPAGSQLIYGSYLGLELYDYRPGRLAFFSPFLPYWVERELQWMVNINIALSVINLLPLPVTDGGKIGDMIIDKYTRPQYRNRIRKITWGIMMGILLLNILTTIF